MNSLSWMLYWADVADSAQDKIGLVAGGLIVAFLGIAFVSTFDLYKGPFTNPAKWKPWMFAVGCACQAINAAIPSKETIYAIAASELGESAFKSETGGKAVKALNAWLDRQLAEPAK